MTEFDDRDPVLGDLLARRAGQLPDHVLAAVDAEVRRTRQVRPAPIELPLRRRASRWPLLAAVAALIVVVGAVTVGQLLPNLPGFGGQQSSSPGGPTQPPPTLPPGETTVASPSPSGPASPAGMWGTTDIDGSPMTLSISMSGSAWAVSYVDLRAVACGGRLYLNQGPATFSANVLTYTGIGGCEGAPADQPGGGSMTFDPTADTLTLTFDDGVELVWRRGPPPPDAFDGSWTASGVAARRLLFEGSGGTRTVGITEAASELCGGDGYEATGTGTIGTVAGEGRFITVTLAGGCPGGAGDSVVKFEYRYETNTLLGPLSAAGGVIATTIEWER